MSVGALVVAGLLAAGEPISVRAAPVPLFLEDPGIQELGRLRYRGGLQLTSTDARFGGVSGLEVDADGMLLAVTDQGHWLSARLLHTDGRLVGIGGVRLGALSDPGGAELARKGDQDAEALARLPDGGRLVAFERRHRMQAYPPGDAGFAAPVTLAPPDELTQAPANGGVEALTVLASGDVIALSEELTADGWVRGWRSAAGGWQAFDLKLDGIARPSGATTLPDGSVVVVERGYRPTTGVLVRLRSIAAEAFRPGARLEGELLAEFRGAMSLDNFEGIAATTGPDGETLLYLISDDNFSPLQRTLLLMFALEPPGPR